MPMLKLIAATILLTTAACGVSHTPTAVSQSPSYGLVLDNDTSQAVTLRGCAGCGSGQLVAAGSRKGFDLPSDSSRVQLDEAAGRTRCLTIMQGISNGKPFIVKVSEAGPC